MNAVSISLDLTTIFCPTCSIPYGVLAFMASTEDQRRKLYCPNGHSGSPTVVSQPAHAPQVADNTNTKAPAELVSSVAELAKLVQDLENKQARAKVIAENQASKIVVLPHEEDSHTLSAPMPSKFLELPPAVPFIKPPEWLQEGQRVMFIAQPANPHLPALVGRTAVIRNVHASTGRVQVDVLNASGQTTGKFHLDDWLSLSPEKEPEYSPVSITVSNKRTHKDLTQIKTGIAKLLQDSGGVSVHIQTIRKALGLESDKDAVRVRDLLGDMVKDKSVYRTSPGMYSVRTKPTTWSQHHPTQAL